MAVWAIASAVVPKVVGSIFIVEGYENHPRAALYEGEWLRFILVIEIIPGLLCLIWGYNAFSIGAICDEGQLEHDQSG